MNTVSAQKHTNNRRNANKNHAHKTTDGRNEAHNDELSGRDRNTRSPISKMSFLSISSEFYSFKNGKK